MTHAATSARNSISRLQAFLDVQASRFACHPGRSYRDGSKSIGQLWRLLPSTVEFVTLLHVGYACRLNRAIDGRGLAPHKIRSLVGCIP
jgi:hypothetical protein